MKFRAAYKKKVYNVLIIDFKRKKTLLNMSNHERWVYFAEVVFLNNTRLKDVNGKEIFEGDILQIENEKYSLHFRETGFYISKDLHGIHCELFLTQKWDLVDKMEIIGNIYEHEELL